MAGPKAEKVAIVEEVKQRFDDADAVLVTEYRGINVADLAVLRRSLHDAGGEYKIYKNTLVRRAVDGIDQGFVDLLTGPTALAFVTATDTRPADAAGVAKALKDFAAKNEHLVVKGGLLGDTLLGVEEAKALADLPSREELLSQFAGVLQAPLTKMARMLNAVPQKFAYGLSALIDAGGAPGAPADPAAADASPEVIADEGVPDAEESAASASIAAEDASVSEESPAEESVPEEPEAAVEPEAGSDESESPSESAATEES